MVLNGSEIAFTGKREKRGWRLDVSGVLSENEELAMQNSKQMTNDKRQSPFISFTGIKAISRIPLLILTKALPFRRSQPLTTFHAHSDLYIDQS